MSSKKTTDKSVLRYPYDALTEETDYLEITAFDYVSVQESAGALTRDPLVNQARYGSFNKQPIPDRRNPKRKTVIDPLSIQSVLLPIPSNVQDGNSVDYTSGSLDGLTANVLGATLKSFEASKDLDYKNAATKIPQVLGSLFKAGTTTDNFNYWTKSIAIQAASIPFGGNITLNQLLARESGEILNPNMELLFNGVNLRSFKFSFKLTPRSKKEAEEIRDIITFFKFNMAPDIGESANFLKTPRSFQLYYKKGPEQHPYLNQFKLCALTDMSVNYTGDNVYTTYSDGSPVSYVLDLGFKELQPIYATDYIGDARKGVGF
jgi:hypothetical protein